MKTSLTDKQAIAVFTLPALIIFTVMVFYPITQTFYRSFFQWDGLSQAKFIFFDNFKTLLKDDLFFISLKNGLIFSAMVTVFQISMGTILTFALLEDRVFGKRILRSSFFIPVVLSVTVACQIWSSIYNAEFGLINKVLEALHLSYQQDWLSNRTWSIFAVTFVNAWHYMGVQFALIYAGAKSIPPHYYEAAKIDGANIRQTHLRITIPLMAETYKMCLIFAIIGGLNAFATMNILTKGGPGTATYTLTYLMYRSAFTINEFGYGCAVAVSLVLECILAKMIINKLVAREQITY